MEFSATLSSPFLLLLLPRPTGHEDRWCHWLGLKWCVGGDGGNNDSCVSACMCVCALAPARARVCVCVCVCILRVGGLFFYFYR